MQVSAWWPSFGALPDDSGLTLSDAGTGLVYRVNGRGEVDPNGVAPFCSRALVRPSTLAPIPTAVAYESRFVRKSGPLTLLNGSPDVVPKGSSSDWHDDSDPHETGGARRNFVSVGFMRHVRGAPDGLAAIQSWTRDQERLPVGHVLAQPFTYDDYRGRAADGWLYDQRDAFGHGVFDPAHLECSILFAGAIAGDGEAMAHLTMLAAWVANTFPGAGPHANRLGWRGSDQERAVGEVLGAYARFALAGIGMGPSCTEFRDRYLAGQDPKQHLVGLLRALLERPPPFGAGHPDARTLPDIGQWNGRAELQGAYGWQNGILNWWVAYVLASGLVNEPLRSQTLAWLAPRTAEFARRAVTSAGVAYAFTRADDFDATALALAQAKAPVELVPRDDGSGLGAIRTPPRASDSEVAIAGLLLLGHPQKAQPLFALRPDPDRDPGTYKKFATYLEPAYALEGR